MVDKNDLGKVHNLKPIVNILTVNGAHVNVIVQLPAEFVVAEER
jgi:hypothetical protein